MATGATLRFHRHVFVDKWSLLIRVAFETGSVSLRQSTKLAQRGCAMHVVAVTALNQSLINAMVIWFGEVSLRGDVAAIAKSRLRVNQQMLRFCRVMGRVAVQAAHVAAGVHRSGEVALLVILAVATQATGIRFLLRQVFEADDFGDISPGCNVF